jgi:hypothetical protein
MLLPTAAKCSGAEGETLAYQWPLVCFVQTVFLLCSCAPSPAASDSMEVQQILTDDVVSFGFIARCCTSIFVKVLGCSAGTLTSSASCCCYRIASVMMYVKRQSESAC